MKAHLLGLVLAGMSSSAMCTAMLPHPVIEPASVGPRFEFVWDAAPEPAPAIAIQAVPEPRGWLMLLCGIGALLALGRRPPPLFR